MRVKAPWRQFKVVEKNIFLCDVILFFSKGMFQKDSPSPSLSFPGLVYSFHSSSALYQIVSPITFKYLHKLLTKTNICKKVVFVNKIPCPFVCLSVGWSVGPSTFQKKRITLPAQLPLCYINRIKCKINLVILLVCIYP